MFSTSFDLWWLSGKKVLKIVDMLKKNNEKWTGDVVYLFFGGARGVMVIVVGNGHGDTSSNPGQDW